MLYCLGAMTKVYIMKTKVFKYFLLVGSKSLAAKPTDEEGFLSALGWLGCMPFHKLDFFSV